MERGAFSQRRISTFPPPPMTGGDASRERSTQSERADVLEMFRTRDLEGSLKHVVKKREAARHPERLLWESVELMMRDESWRDMWVRQLATGKQDIDPAESFAEYKKNVAKYRTLVELCDHSDDRTLGQQEIIPHMPLNDLRARLADLLANQSFYFPDSPSSSEDQQEAFSRLLETYSTQQQEGRAAETACIGLLRYGPEWLRGGVDAAKHLRPAMHVERTLLREDILESRGSSQKAGQFQGYDLLYRVPQESRVRFVQLKTGALAHKVFHANLPAPLLTRAWQQAASSGCLRKATPEVPGVAAAQMYRDAIEAITDGLPLEPSAREQMRKTLLPAKRATPRETKSIAPSPVLSMKGVDAILQSPAFRKFAFEHDMPTHDMPVTVHAGNFHLWADFLRKLRVSHPNAPFWKTASPTKHKPRVGGAHALNI